MWMDKKQIWIGNGFQLNISLQGKRDIERETLLSSLITSTGEIKVAVQAIVTEVIRWLLITIILVEKILHRNKQMRIMD